MTRGDRASLPSFLSQVSLFLFERLIVRVGDTWGRQRSLHLGEPCCFSWLMQLLLACSSVYSQTPASSSSAVLFISVHVSIDYDYTTWNLGSPNELKGWWTNSEPLNWAHDYFVPFLYSVSSLSWASGLLTSLNLPTKVKKICINFLFI